MTSWLVAKTGNVKGGKREHQIKEHPLLHACCNDDHFGDVNIDFRKETNIRKPLYAIVINKRNDCCEFSTFAPLLVQS